jgi:hypothetical protein
MGMRSRSRLMPIDTAPMPPLPDEDVNARNWTAIHATVIKIHSEIHIADSASTRANDNVRRACMFVEISDCRIQIAEFTNHLNPKSEIYTLQIQVVMLPGIKTVVIALSNDPPTLKLHEDGEPISAAAAIAGRDASSDDTAAMMSMTGLAASPGIAVLPMCSIGPASHDASVRRSASRSCSNRSGHDGLYSTISTGCSPEVILISRAGSGESRTLRHLSSRGNAVAERSRGV